MNSLPSFSELWRKTHIVFCAGFWFRLTPESAGNLGSVLALGLYCLIFPGLSLNWSIAFLLASFIVGIWFCESAATELGAHDHGAVVWDEFVGQWMVVLYLHHFSEVPLVASLLIGFVLFRLFDIVKPWPIRWFDRNVHGGLGVMLDDVLAAVMAIAVVFLFEYLGLIGLITA